ncbi:hypothetical protein [Burkholderia metallica]|uniref:hypothetical protein n=1 Tax=Burkholderia metallica TaxID=488729 RepID=UPI0020C6FDE0|nr:hypothetical protein [Burkholderia metallica]
MWLIYLREERKLAPSSLGPTIGALRFLYRVTLKRDWSDEDFPLPKKPVRLPVILSFDEVKAFFDAIPSLKPRAMLGALQKTENNARLARATDGASR